jgi:tetratricopeptide (TPR) repeat protein
MTSAFHQAVAILILGILSSGWLAGCATPARKLDANVLWDSAEMRQPSTMRCVDRYVRLYDDYITITRIARDSDLRGRAYLRLAEMDMARGEYLSAQQRLEHALRAELPHEYRRQALLMLGDVLERFIRNRDSAIVAYRQILNEYPETPESELARLRLKGLNHEN